MIIVVDDERTFEHFPDEETIYFRTSGEAIDFLSKSHPADIEEIWLDHDLGEDDTAMRVVDFLVQCAHFSWGLNTLFTIYVHSMNPVGAQNIVRALERYYTVERVPLPVCV